MTPQKKAEELHRKFWTNRDPIGENLRLTTSWSSAKQCALIAVDEIIDAIDWHEYEVPNDQLNFWFKVKQEIEKL